MPEPISLRELARETARRRTFAIISHPDAGKTTLTEKLLLYSGLLRTAGMVKNRKGKLATSDWMGMEQERGISITSSAMQFEYKGLVINVLDTPGHQDFSEDTYRTLTAADAAIMVLDAGKGVETQTRKLFAVCRLRRIPVLTFINKLDLPGRDPLDLMTEVEQALGIHGCALNWPIGAGREFVGVIDRRRDEAVLFQKVAGGGARKADFEAIPLADARLDERIDPALLAKARTDLELLDVAGNRFDRDAFLRGEVTPVFFGSAMNNFGIELFFDAFCELAPSPGPRPIERSAVGKSGGSAGASASLDPLTAPFSAYVFKLQANMDRRHRDVLAFMRVCSGVFEPDLMVRHERLGKTVRLTRPHSMVAQSREALDVAYPGDVVGLINRDTFRIGDTLSVDGGFVHQRLPAFQPEQFARISPKATSDRKRFDKGLEQLIAEGTVQRLGYDDGDGHSPLVAAVGRLQFEVLQYRLRDEYGVETVLTPMPYSCSAWLIGELKTFKLPLRSIVARDADKRTIVLFVNEWDKRLALRENPEHQLLDLA